VCCVRPGKNRKERRGSARVRHNALCRQRAQVKRAELSSTSCPVFVRPNNALQPLCRPRCLPLNYSVQLCVLYIPWHKEHARKTSFLRCIYTSFSRGSLSVPSRPRKVVKYFEISFCELQCVTSRSVANLYMGLNCYSELLLVRLV